MLKHALLLGFVLAGPCAALFASVAQAQSSRPTQRMYKCIDAKGKTYYTQVPPKECQDRTTQELSPGGRVVRENEVLTPEQQAARDAERKKKAEEDRATADERRKSVALLNTYNSVKDIDEARARALKQAQDAIAQTERRIADAEKRRGDFEKEKEFYVKKSAPPKLQQDVRQNEVEIQQQRELLEAKKKEIGGINAKYDEDKRRYLELTRPVARK
jgi:hypothetical protein